MCNNLSFQNQSFPFSSPDPKLRLFAGAKSVQIATRVGQSIGFQWIFVSCTALLPTPLLRFFYKLVGSRRCFLASGLNQILTPLLLSSQRHKLLGLDVVELYMPVHCPNVLHPGGKLSRFKLFLY
jgi:hypothetical protein